LRGCSLRSRFVASLLAHGDVGVRIHDANLAVVAQPLICARTGTHP